MKGKSRWLTSIIIVIIFLVGLSRLYLGVHFISDVLAGWLAGGLMVWAFVILEKPVLAFWRKQGFSLQVLLALASSLAMIFLAWIARVSLGSWTIPAAWLQNARSPIDPLALSDIFTTAGLWLGLCVGAAWFCRLGGFSARGSERQKILRYCVGLAGLGLFWYGLGAVFPRSETLISYSLRYLRYALCGFWVTALAPLVFRKLHLIE